MEARTIFEIIGYVGSALVLASFLMSSVLRLRIINSAGSLVSVIYGICVHTYPTVVMNAALLIINIYYIVKLSSHHAAAGYRMTPADVTDDFITFFIEQHKEDIKKFFPRFSLDKTKMNYARFLLYNDTIVGVMIGTLEGDVLNINLDYTTPSYRDFSVGTFAYSEIAKEGVKKVRFLASIPESFTYLKKIGFEKTGDIMEKNF